MSHRVSLRAKLIRWIDGRPPSDPLYLSNRGFIARMKPWIALVVTGILIVIGFQIAAARARRNERLPQVLRNGALGSVVLTGFDSPDLQVVEVGVNASGTKLIGTVRNNTPHVIALGRLSFDLDDASGNRVGTAGKDLTHILPDRSMRFEVPIAQRQATAAYVTGISVE